MDAFEEYLRNNYAFAIRNRDLTPEQIRILSDRQEFLEDCIAEMAIKLYKEEEKI